MALVQYMFEIELPDEAELGYVYNRPDSWAVGLRTKYEIRNAEGSSLGGKIFGGDGRDTLAASEKAAAKLLEYIEYERKRSLERIRNAKTRLR